MTLNEISREIYQIAKRNLAQNAHGQEMPVSEEMFLTMTEYTNPREVDLAPVMDLPQMSYINMLYFLFQNRVADNPEDWSKAARALDEDEFRKRALNMFLNSEDVAKYNIRVINNPFEINGQRLLRMRRKSVD